MPAFQPIYSQNMRMCDHWKLQEAVEEYKKLDRYRMGSFQTHFELYECLKLKNGYPISLQKAHLTTTSTNFNILMHICTIIISNSKTLKMSKSKKYFPSLF